MKAKFPSLLKKSSSRSTENYGNENIETVDKIMNNNVNVNIYLF